MNVQSSISGLILCAVMALAGCSKPPACGDAATLQAARNIILDNLKKGLAAQAQNDPDGWIQKFSAALVLKFSRIVSEGYKEDAKKQMCSAILGVANGAGLANGAQTEVPVQYSTQLTEDRDARFAIEMSGASVTILKLVDQAGSYYLANRWSGDWAGTYRCGGIDAAQSGPQGPFTQQVTLVVRGTEAHMQRTANGGGYEKMGGNFVTDQAGRVTLELGGPGQNSPTDGWIAEFSGPVDGNRVVIDGQIRLQRRNASEEDQVLRRCKLDLTMVKGTTAPVLKN